VACFLEVQTRHDRQINRSSQVYQVGVGLILDFHGAFLLGFFVVGTFFGATVIVIVCIAVLAQNLGFELPVRFFVLFPLGVKFENVQSVLDVDFVVEIDLVGDLVFFFH
jgi:hypothetical protein